LGQALAGWQLAGIVTLQDGQPFAVGNASGASPGTLTSLGYSRSPNVNSAFTGDIILGGPERYFDPAAFSLPSCPWTGSARTGGPCEIGNVGRNVLIGPGLARWDLSIRKNTSLTERWGLQFRAEFFNMLNRPNFAKPSANIFTTNGRSVADAGRINSTVGTARQIQFGLKLLF
jgi:hypothetical protein